MTTITHHPARLVDGGFAALNSDDPALTVTALQVALEDLAEQLDKSGRAESGEDAGERSCDMTAAAHWLATGAQAGGSVTVVFAAASVIMGAMALSAVAIGLDGSGTLVDFTVCLATLALLALASTTALTIAVAHRDSTANVRADL